MEIKKRVRAIERRAKIVGVTMDDVCAKAGVYKSTVNRWVAGVTDPLRKIVALEKAIAQIEARKRK